MPIRLLFEIFGLSGTHRELKAFAYFDLAVDDGKLNYGFHTAKLMRPPFKNFS